VQLARSFTRKFGRKPCELSDAHVSKRMMKTSEFRRAFAHGTVVIPIGKEKTRLLLIGPSPNVYVDPSSTSIVHGIPHIAHFPQ
jgi:hypothetical protein